MKLSQYNLVLEMDYGLLVYNVGLLKGFKVFKSNQKEFEHFTKLLNTKALNSEDEMVKTLYSMGYIVDDDFDEFEYVKQKVTKKLDSNLGKQSIMLHVTNNCNFRCVYCFKEANINYLSDETWDGLYKYIEKQYNLNNNYTAQIIFYGGEPLLRINKITAFMKRINNLFTNTERHPIEFQIITNGYLLTPDIYDKLSKLGINLVQITLDGFAEQHNKTRPLANGEGSWDKIIENIKYINNCNDNVQIVIRTNFNDNNSSVLAEFKEWLTNEFKNKKFIFDLHAITAASTLVDKNLAKDPFSKDSKQLKKIFNNKAEKNFCFNEYGAMACDTYRQYGMMSILTNGKITKCLENFNDDCIIGYLSNDGEIIYTKDIYQVLHRNECDDCKTCIAYPMCGARTCIMGRQCEEVIKIFEDHFEEVQRGLVTIF